MDLPLNPKTLVGQADARLFLDLALKTVEFVVFPAQYCLLKSLSKMRFYLHITNVLCGVCRLQNTASSDRNGNFRFVRGIESCLENAQKKEKKKKEKKREEKKKKKKVVGGGVLQDSLTFWGNSDTNLAQTTARKNNNQRMNSCNCKVEMTAFAWSFHYVVKRLAELTTFIVSF